MTVFALMAHLAASLFLAPTPALILLSRASDTGAIDPLKGMLALILSAGGYWLALAAFRQRAALADADVNARRVADPANIGARLSDHQRDESVVSPSGRHVARRNSELALRSQDDIPDPLAIREGVTSAALFQDRFNDIMRLKALVQQQRGTLLNQWYRSVQRDVDGTRSFGDWAFDADRFLMSVSYMARTLTRHEAIAIVTAEVASLVAQPRATPEVDAVDPVTIGAGRAPVPAMTPLYDAATPAVGHIHHVPRAQCALASVHRVPFRPKAALAATAQRRDLATRCVHHLERHGWTAQLAQVADGDPIDLFAEHGTTVVGVLCSKGVASVTEAEIRKLARARSVHGLDSVVVVAGSGADKAAQVVASAEGIALLGEDDLADLHIFIGRRHRAMTALVRSKRFRTAAE
jgi:hypothetical protein